MEMHGKSSPRRLGARRQRGQGMTEYIIITALIALAAIAVVGAFGGVIQQQFYNMAEAMAGKKPEKPKVNVKKPKNGGSTDMGTYEKNTTSKGGD